MTEQQHNDLALKIGQLTSAEKMSEPIEALLADIIRAAFKDSVEACILTYQLASIRNVQIKSVDPELYAEAIQNDDTRALDITNSVMALWREFSMIKRIESKLWQGAASLRVSRVIAKFYAWAAYDGQDMQQMIHEFFEAQDSE